MNEKVLMRGSDVIGEASVRAGCRFYAGYPITPQNELPEYLSARMVEVGGTFIQGESEIASINMLIGASAVGSMNISGIPAASTSAVRPRIPLPEAAIQRPRPIAVPMFPTTSSWGPRRPRIRQTARISPGPAMTRVGPSSAAAARSRR